MKFKRQISVALAFIMAATLAFANVSVNKTDAAVRTVTYSDNYTDTAAAVVGMSQTETFAGMGKLVTTLEDVQVKPNGAGADGYVKLKYELTLGNPDKLEFEWDELNVIADVTDFKDANGTVIKDNVEVPAGTYTAEASVKWASIAYGYYDFGGKVYSNNASATTDNGYCNFRFGFVFPLTIGTLTHDAITSVTSDTITFNTSELYSQLGRNIKGFAPLYKKSTDTEWTQEYKGLKIEGLTPNTDYDIMFAYTSDVKGKDGSVTEFVSPLSNVISVKTGLDNSVLPAIKSVKITKAKKKTKTVKGYWYWSTTGHWVYSKPYTYKYTQFKVTVTLKNKVPGAVGYWINVGGGKTKVGSGTKFTFTGVVDGHKVGKKVYVSAAAFNNKNGLGTTDYGKSKSVKIKK